MIEAGPFLQELDDVVSRGSPESRLRALWHATDLLIVGRYSEDETWVFGEVIGRLSDEIEVMARSELARRLAGSGRAPVNIVNKLAFDDSIDVAGPILRHSERLDVRALVANAQTKSQQHLLAISKRNSISEAVTDVLVTRGNQEVVRSVAANQGARFSGFGILHLLKRSQNDSILAEHLGQRRDIPRHLFQQLIAKASDDAMKKLQAESPEMAGHVHAIVGDVAAKMHSKFGPASKNYFEAKKAVAVLHQYGNLGEGKILEFAQAHRFEETIVALSLLSALPADVVERVLVDKNGEMILIVAKAIELSWETTMALLFLGAEDHRISTHRLDDMKRDFARLNTETSRSVLRFYQSRKSSAAANSEVRRLGTPAVSV